MRQYEVTHTPFDITKEGRCDLSVANSDQSCMLMRHDLVWERGRAVFHARVVRSRRTHQSCPVALCLPLSLTNASPSRPVWVDPPSLMTCPYGPLSCPSLCPSHPSCSCSILTRPLRNQQTRSPPGYLLPCHTSFLSF